jgi:hypothetical protein
MEVMVVPAAMLSRMPTSYPAAIAASRRCPDTCLSATQPSAAETTTEPGCIDVS